MLNFLRKNLIVVCTSKAYSINHISKARWTRLFIMHVLVGPAKTSTSPRITRTKADLPAPSTAKALKQWPAGPALSPRPLTTPLPSRLLPLQPRVARPGATPSTIPPGKTWAQWAASIRITSLTLLKSASPILKLQASAATRRTKVRRKKRYSKDREAQRKRQ